jgi:hypothetical protein
LEWPSTDPANAGVSDEFLLGIPTFPFTRRLKLSVRMTARLCRPRTLLPVAGACSWLRGIGRRFNVQA